MDRKLTNLTKNVKDFKTKNGKLEKEIISVRHGVDNWKSGVHNMKDQVLDEVKKDIENDLVEIKIEQGVIEREVSAMKEQFL